MSYIDESKKIVFDKIYRRNSDEDNAKSNINDVIKSYSSDNTLNAEYQYTYNSSGVLSKIYDALQNTETRYTDGKTEIYILNGSGEADDELIYSTEINDNEETVEFFGGSVYTQSRDIPSENLETGETTTKSVYSSQYKTFASETTTDYYGRLKSRYSEDTFYQEPGWDVKMYQNTEYGYLPLSEDQTTTLVNSYKTEIGARADIVDESLVEEIPEETITPIKEIEYLYDYNSLRNITRVRKVENGVTSTLYSYVYDEAEQIVRENNFELGKTYVYVYDIGGNIVQKIEYTVTEETLGTPLSTINYGYDNVWKDKLVSYNGTAITSDAMGNPLNAVSLNAIGGLENLELEWNGRQLSAVTRNTQRFEYSYDSNGMRTEIREYDQNGELETVCHYAWQNGKLVGLDIRDGSGEVRYVVKMIYDDAGESTGYIIFDEENSKQEVMHFQKNLQGDITGVFCESYGSEVLTYKYDAWGNITPEIIGTSGTMLYWSDIALLLTPITYRGYMYDPYIGMYYLQSRYYNPAYGRFLNADAIIKTGKSLGANIFVYCENNPVNYVDPLGYASTSNSELIAEIIKVIIAMYAITYYLFDGMDINKTSGAKKDFNGLYKIDLRYSKNDNENEWLSLEFGDFEAWRNSSTYYNNNTSIHLNSQIDYITNESAYMGTGQDVDVLSVFISDIVLAGEIIVFSIQYSPYKKIYEAIWGANGVDPKNKDYYYGYRVTGDTKYNGAYAFSFSTGKWKELDL